MRAKRVVDQSAVDISRFELPLVEGPLISGTAGISPDHMPTARNLEELHKQAYEEGLACGRRDGYEHGIEQAAADIKEGKELLLSLLDNLAEPFAELDDEVVQSVADLALLVARHLIRRELRAEPGEVVAVVRETISQLPVASRNPFIRLNPDDVDLVRNALAIGDDPRSWRLEPDPLVMRGGCLVETESSRIDASVETRLAAIASKMLGGEREGDRAG
jgi:flagellar assembly protein FliH